MSDRTPEAPSVSPDEKRSCGSARREALCDLVLGAFSRADAHPLVPAVAKVLAYYANLMLISSFLGLGMGAMVARRGWRLFRWFPLLLVVTVGFLLLSRNVLLPGSLVELRFFSDVPGLVNYLVLVGIFVLNTALFVPLGEQVGQLFESLPPLRAYMWDLGGSFCGTVAFGVFSLLYFSPLLGILGVMLAYLVLTERPQRLPTLALFALTALGVSQATDPNTIWSPYQNFTIRESLGSPTVSEPPEGLREMQDPPFYMVSVNQNFYQSHGSVDPRRYSRPIEFLEAQGDLGQIPYTVHGNPRNVLVVGAGGGPDVEGALLAGATHVDAVDIDPVTVRISRRFNSSGVSVTSALRRTSPTHGSSATSGPTCVAVFWRTASLECGAPAVATTSWSRSVARAAVCVRPVMRAVWSRPPPISSITSCRRFPCANGCSPCRNASGLSCTTTPRSPAPCCTSSYGPFALGSDRRAPEPVRMPKSALSRSFTGSAHL